MDSAGDTFETLLARLPEHERRLALERLKAEVLAEATRQEAARIVAAGAIPDLTEHIRRGDQILADPESSRPWLFHGLIEQGSTNGLIAPTNSGGSTLLVGFAGALLSGRPLFGHYATTPGPYRVAYINPEEAELEPVRRLVKAGLTPDDLGAFLSIHTRDARLYLNRPDHVDALIERIEATEWPEGLAEAPLALFIDGLQPTLSGKVWGEDLEAWKAGVGRLRLAVEPVAVFARAQTTTGAARYSKGRGNGGEGENVTGEDVAGGQFMQWPDNRLTLNRSKGGGRILNVRGRRSAVEAQVFLAFDADTWSHRVVGVSKMLRAHLRLSGFLGSDEWATVKGGPLTSARAVAEYLAAEDQRLEALHPSVEGPTSASVFRKAIAEGWAYDSTAQTWVSKGASK